MPAFQPYRGKPTVRNDREVEKTSASFEARSAPRLYPTEGLGVKFPGPTGYYCTATFMTDSLHSTDSTNPSVAGFAWLAISHAVGPGVTAGSAADR